MGRGVGARLKLFDFSGELIFQGKKSAKNGIDVLIWSMADID